MVQPVVLMPDAHVGIGASIGSVVATRGTIIPSAVGVDLGCGMSAVRIDCTATDLPDNLNPLLDAIAKAVPPIGHGDTHAAARSAIHFSRRGPAPSGLADMARAMSQLGTLGSGNHFLEVSLDYWDRVWIVVHSGSRGVGNYLARQHIKIATALDTEAPSKDLAALSENSDEFRAYVGDMRWCQDYAYANREAMLEAVLDVFPAATGIPEASSNRAGSNPVPPQLLRV